jgi:hypothetical protein
MKTVRIHAVQFPQKFDLIPNGQFSFLLINKFHDRK